VAAARTCLALAAVALASFVYAQPAFRSRVDLVTVPVVVTAKDSSFRIGELTPADFRVYEDGVAQEVTVVSHEPRPLSVCILLDSSPSMAAGRQGFAIRAIDTVLDDLGPDDEASLLFFASKVRLVFGWTPARAVPKISWLDWRLSLGTALLDAVREALQLVERASNPVPVILVVSDGGENASRTPLAKLVATRRQSETAIYGMDTNLPPSRIAPPVNRAFSDFLPDLVGDSGGMVYSVRSAEAGESAALTFLAELRSQFTLGYAPKKPLDGTYRRLKVETTSKGLAVRHRGGYLAAEDNR
jgi:Ca-activated chloride channel family protein